VITRGGNPVARIVPVVEPTRRELGRDRGRFDVPEDSNAPLPDEIVAAFEDLTLITADPSPPMLRPSADRTHRW
jgi:antitoxin (DNA-binding transcriptional repressor) of toxin-antitoxin stability system